MTELPEEYVVQKFYEHAGYPKHKKITNVHEAGCPVCQEGHSWGRKRRLYYIPKENVICCHNCGWYGNTSKWIQEVARMSREEIEYEIQTGEYRYIDISIDKPTDIIKPTNTESLPRDSINMFDALQLQYYNDNTVVKMCTDVITTRRLDTAANRPKTLYMSLTDPVHKNRLCLPFYDSSNNIVHYQTRGLLTKDLIDRPKYLSKINSQKTLFNFNSIDTSTDDIYIFEGPIDSFFVKNSVAVAGIQENTNSVFTTSQRQMLQTKPFMKKIWVLDNQWNDHASYRKTERLISDGAHVFIWPKQLQQFKDFNDMAIKYALDEIKPTFINRHVYHGLSAKLAFNAIR
jgi:hypothetical protein